MESDIKITRYTSNNELQLEAQTATATRDTDGLASIEALLKIQGAVGTRNCDNFHGLGTLHEYEVLIKKAQEVRDHLNSIELDPIEGLDEITQEMKDVIFQLQGLNFDFHVENKVDDSAVLLQISNFVSAFSNLQEMIRDFSPKVTISGEITLPESLQGIKDATAHLQPLIECAKSTVDKFSQSREISAETQDALETLQMIIDNAEDSNALEDQYHGASSSADSNAHFPTWALILSIVLPVLGGLALLIGLGAWMWNRNRQIVESV